MQIEEMEKKIGKFTPKIKFIQFIGVKGNVNFISQEALIDGKYFSGLDMDSVKFKLTLRDDYTVDFEEVSGNRFTQDQLSRFLELMCEKDIAFLNKQSVLNDLEFTHKIGDKEISLYLQVEYQSPIHKLASIFDDEDESNKLDDLIELNETGINQLIDILFEGENEDEPEMVDSIINNEVESPIIDNLILEDSFKKMREEKLLELKKNLQVQEIELKRFEFEKSQAEKKIQTAKNEIDLLESRIDSLKPIADSNGFIVFVSEEINQKTNLDEDTQKIIFDTVSKVKSINAEAFMKLFENGEYQIRIAKKDDNNIEEITDLKQIPEDVQGLLLKIGVTFIKDEDLYTFFYQGELKWHDLVNKFIKSGFIQDSEFDKMCGSNSYTK